MRYVITGGANGLGNAICEHLQVDHEIIVWDLPVVNVANWRSVCAAAAIIRQVDCLVNCAGVNYVDWFPNLHPEEDFARIMRVNAQGILHCTQALLPLLRDGGTVCNIISNASIMPMTASLAYCASKAAAMMMTKQMAHELGPTHDITVFGVSPNKLAGTQMSVTIAERVAAVRGWSLEEVARRQNAALPARSETPVRLVAEFVAYLLTKKERHRFLQGCIIPYGGPS